MCLVRVHPRHPASGQLAIPHLPSQTVSGTVRRQRRAAKACRFPPFAFFPNLKPRAKSQKLGMRARWHATLLALACVMRTCYGSTTRALCYGDSLTAGFWAGGSRFHPYAGRLSVRLGGCTVDHIGLSGYTSAQMVQTLTRKTEEGGDIDSTARRWVSLEDALTSTHYTHVIILAGTNDLHTLRHAGGHRSADDVVGDVKTLLRRALSSGARTLSLTMPQPAFESVRPQMALGRGEINDGLRRFAEATDNVWLVDLELALPHLNASEAERQRLWDDGLHLTPAGYDQLADTVYDALLEAGATPCDNGSAAGKALDIRHTSR